MHLSQKMYEIELLSLWLVIPIELGRKDVSGTVCSSKNYKNANYDVCSQKIGFVLKLKCAQLYAYDAVCTPVHKPQGES